jgi:hypothetical protein
LPFGRNSDDGPQWFALSPQRDHFGDSFLLGLVPHRRVFVVSSEPERDFSGGFRLTSPAGCYLFEPKASRLFASSGVG